MLSNTQAGSARLNLKKQSMLSMVDFYDLLIARDAICH